MNISQIEKNTKKLIDTFSKESFVFDFLRAYGIPKATVTLLQKGKRNLSKREDRIILKKKLFFQEIQEGADLHNEIDDLQKDSATMNHHPRFIAVTDYQTLLAIDTKTKDALDIPFNELSKHFDFFLPLAGIEKRKVAQENPADRKAAEKMAKLYDGILEDNNVYERGKTHDLNVFLARLLFCFFAEDTGIFKDGIFTESVASHTNPDGSDLHTYLDRIFCVLSRKVEDRGDIPAYLEQFPYVNGGLFSKEYWVPTFSAKSRRIILECAELDWSEINPDIFGSMIQAVTHPGERGSLGMHYTSVPNIMKVIEPLFLNDLREELENSRGNKKKLEKLLYRLSKIKFFDPACGSGNFLIITYKEIRRLQIEILEEMGAIAYPKLHLSQFYGIEIDDFAHQVAKLSLYLAEHQMNVEFQKHGLKTDPILPLQDSGNIVCGNATRLDWNTVCPNSTEEELYVLGNPPYVGSSMQGKEQKSDLALIFSKFKNYKNLDYISCWFFLGRNFILHRNAKLAFVTTNSICQGEQVALLWPFILEEGVEIFFAIPSFKWTNNAKGNAGVTVSIVGLRNSSKKAKYIYDKEHTNKVFNINAYLVSGRNIYIPRTGRSISRLPRMVYGNKSTENGYLFLTPEEKDSLIESEPGIAKYIKRLVGSSEFIRGITKWCFWITDKDLKDATKYNIIAKRLELISKWRATSKASCTVEFAKYPHKFKQITHKSTPSIIIPRVSSERRQYIPCGFLDKDSIILDSAQAIYDAEPWVFGVVTSKMHMVWVRAVAGRLKTDYRYSSALCYNTFPFPSITEKQKKEIQRHVYEVLEARENYSEKTMSELYDPDKMPDELRVAHKGLDNAIERIYRLKPFGSDEERLEYLFALYEKMVEEKKAIKTKNNEAK